MGVLFGAALERPYEDRLRSLLRSRATRTPPP
jgi:hypothetical protein